MPLSPSYPLPLPPPPACPAERAAIPKGLRDDVLSPDLPGPGHLATHLNPAAASDCSDTFDVVTVANALGCLDHAIFSADPAFSADEITDFVYKRWQGGELLEAGSAEEAWSSIHRGWRALKYLAGLPGWVPAVVSGAEGAEGDAIAPGAKVRALAGVTARLLGDARAVDVVSNAFV